MAKRTPSSAESVDPRQPAHRVPMAEAKNNLSALVARVEQGEEIAIATVWGGAANRCKQPWRDCGNWGKASRLRAT